MKKIIFIIILLLVPVFASAQSKLGISKMIGYSENHVYLCPGYGIKHESLTTSQPEYWYGAQLIVELSETIEVAGRLKWDFGNGSASGSKPDGELGIWYKIGL